MSNLSLPSKGMSSIPGATNHVLSTFNPLSLCIITLNISSSNTNIFATISSHLNSTILSLLFINLNNLIKNTIIT